MSGGKPFWSDAAAAAAAGVLGSEYSDASYQKYQHTKKNFWKGLAVLME